MWHLELGWLDSIYGSGGKPIREFTEKKGEWSLSKSQLYQLNRDDSSSRLIKDEETGELSVVVQVEIRLTKGVAVLRPPRSAAPFDTFFPQHVFYRRLFLRSICRPAPLLRLEKICTHLGTLCEKELVFATVQEQNGVFGAAVALMI